MPGPAREVSLRNLPAPQRGENHPCSKLTEAQVTGICKRYAAGETQMRLACEYGVGQSTISRVVRGESWAHVGVGYLLRKGG